MSIGARRRPEDLSPSDRERLREAHERLRRAAREAEQFAGGELHPSMNMPVNRGIVPELREVDAAEAELWRLREELLGWERPGSALPARDVLDWFSEEDEIYDSEDE